MSLGRNLGILALAMLAALGAVGGVAWLRGGPLGLVAAAVAAGVCWSSVSLAFVLADRFRRLGNPVAGILGGTVVRLGLPLAAGLALSKTGGPLADAGIFGLIVVFYLIALAVETLLMVRTFQQPHRPASSA